MSLGATTSAPASTLLTAAGGQEFERAAGPWHADWPALNTMLRATGSAIDWLGFETEQNNLR